MLMTVMMMMMMMMMMIYDDDDDDDDDDDGSHHRIDSADSLPPVTCAANAPRRGSFWPDKWQR